MPCSSGSREPARAETAISKIGATGSVSCVTSAQIPVHTVLDNGDFVNDLLTPSLDLQLNCGDIAGFDGLEFISRSDADASLNWMFSEAPRRAP